MRNNRLLIDSLYILIFPTIFLAFWLTVVYIDYKKRYESIFSYPIKSNFDICEYFDSKKAIGPLCIDICIEGKIKNTKTYLNNRYSLISYNNYVSSFVCLLNDKNDEIKLIIDLAEIKIIILDKIRNYLNYLTDIDNKIDYMVNLADVNKDNEINLLEANNLLWLINNRQSFYMLILTGKNYIPSIKRYCGSCIETDEIINFITLKEEIQQEHFLSYISNDKTLLPKWLNRCKISLGILEFYIDISSFNPNDELGYDSLYLCSQIEISFGYTFEIEAKLIDFENLISIKQLENKLENKYCKFDSDCSYNTQCSTKCDIKTKKCTSKLNKLQIIDFCEFLKRYLYDVNDLKKSLQSIIQRCLKLKLFDFNKEILFKKLEMPVSFENLQLYSIQSNYWNISIEYTNIINDLKTILWKWSRTVKDPIITKKKNNVSTKLQSLKESRLTTFSYKTKMKFYKKKF